MAFNFVSERQFSSVLVVLTCTNCNKAKKAIPFEIDCESNKQLFKNPITFCEQPKIFYDLSLFSCLWEKQDLLKCIEFFSGSLKLTIFCWYFSNNVRKFEKFEATDAANFVLNEQKYLKFFFANEEILIEQSKQVIDGKGIYIKGDFLWRNREVIELNAPTSVINLGKLYGLSFCNQYINDGHIVNKTETFNKITTQLKQWLSESFSTSRGADCFDKKNT